MKHMLKDILKFIQALLPQTLSATTAITGADLQDFNSVSFLVNVGAASGTLAGTDKWSLIVQDSDVDVNGSYAAVTDSNNVFVGQGASAAGMETAASGIAKEVDAPADASQVYVIHYRGAKRFARLNLVKTGSVNLTCAVSTVLGDPEILPPL